MALQQGMQLGKDRSSAAHASPARAASMSIPIVALLLALNVPLVKRDRMLVLPTPESPARGAAQCNDVPQRAGQLQVAVVSCHRKSPFHPTFAHLPISTIFSSTS